MTKLTDLTKAINRILKSNFPNHKIYAGEVTEGFQRPSFFTQIIPLSMEYENVNYKSNRLMVVITYFNQNDTELENLKMYDSLIEVFGRTLKVNNRYLSLRNISSSKADGSLQFSFDLDYWSRLSKEEEYELMRELEMKTDKE